MYCQKSDHDNYNDTKTILQIRHLQIGIWTINIEIKINVHSYGHESTYVHTIIM